ncbi:tudor domain-containing protein 6 [Pogona vitticeps]
MCSVLPGPGSSVTLRVSFIELHPEVPLVKLWGFPGERRDEYLRLTEEVQARAGPRLSSSGPGGHADSLALNDLCLVELGGRWHRCRVVGRPAPRDYRVFLLDEGRTASAAVSSLARGSRELFQLPSEVLGCVVADLVPSRSFGAVAATAAPLGSRVQSFSWGPGALEFLGCLQGKEVTGVVREVLIAEHLMVLELPWLLAQMQRLGLASYISPHAFGTLLNTCLGGCPAAAFPSEPSSSPAKATVHSSVGQSQRDPLSYFYPQLDLNVTEPVSVTHVSGPYRVYCQLRSFSREIQLLSDVMYQSFEAIRGRDLQESLPAPGSPCAARGIDGCWYRALLLEVYSRGGPEEQPGAVAQVICVDYGRKEFVTKKNLRHLPTECFRMPVVTYPCSLQGITDGGTGWTHSQISQLKALLLGKEVQAHIEIYCPFEHLYYVTLYGENGLNLNSLYGVQSHCLAQSFLHSDQGCTSDLMTELESGDAPDKEESESFQGVLSTLAPTLLPVVRLKAGECHRAQVSFFQNPSKFWMYLHEHYQSLCLLNRNLHNFYSQSKKLEGILLQPKPGSLCCVMLKENTYHRALVIKVQGKGIEVYLVDRGDTKIVDLHNVKELLPQFRELPAVALRCALAHSSPNQLWSPDAAEYFRKAMLGKELVIKVLGMQEDIYIVEVFDNSLAGEKNLGKIISQGKDTTHEIQMPFQKMINESLKRGPYNAVADVSSITPNSLSAVVPNHSWIKPEFYFDEQLEVGSTVNVVVSCTENPSIFWCQLAKHSGHLRALMAKIQDYCAHSLQPYDWSSPVCLAKYSEDNKWYRGLITSTERYTEKVEVAYVDYGNKECVSLKDICATKAEFLHLKAQAFRCSLYNLIQPKGQDPFVWDEKASEAFQEFVDSASRIELKCTIFASAALNNTEVFRIVDLITPFESVCQFLTRRNLARPVQPEKSLIPSVHLLSYYYSTHNLKIGSEEVIYVTHVNDPSFFYCQLASSTAALNQLSSSIGKLSKMWHNLQTSQAPGNVYVAKYSDGNWYRAIVTSAKSTKKIFFVDFGNTELLKDEDLIVVPNDAYELLRLPRLAIKCSLSDVADPPKDATVWFEKAVLDKPLKALIVAKESDGTLIIELYDGKMQINAKLKQNFSLESSRMLSKHVEHEVSLSRCPLGREANTEIIPSLTDTVKLFHDSKKSCIENQETMRSSKPSFSWWRRRVEQQETKREVARKSPGLIDRRESLEDKKGRDFLKGPFQKREEKTHDENCSQSRINTNFVPKNICDLPQKMIKPGLKTLVYISHINDPSDFYVQLVEDQPLLDIISEKLSSSSTFESLKEQKLHIGDLICAVFADDGSWYRAVVSEEPSDELVSVVYIDYGNTAVVDICKTGQLLEDCSSFPVMSIHCALHGGKTVRLPEWTEEKILYFSQRTNEVQLNGEFVEKIEGKWEILLCDKKGNVTMDLINSYPEDPESHVVDTRSKKEIETGMINLCEVALGKNENSASNTNSMSFHWKTPKVGQTVKIFSVAAKNPGYFWCQLIDMDNLDSIERKLQEVEELEGIILDDIVSGCPCLAKQSKDGRFYRAVVSNIEQNILTVIHVDYGTEELTCIEMVRKIPHELLAIPPQAFLCCLFGFNVEEGSWTEGVNKVFCDIVAGCPVDVKIMDKKDHGSFAIPIFIVELAYQKINIKEQMKSFWKCSTENSGSTVASICRLEEENNNGQGKCSETVVFKTETCLPVSAEYTDISDSLPYSKPLHPIESCSLDAGKRTKEALPPTSPTYQTRHQATVEAVDTEDQHSVFESFDGEMDHYISEKKCNRSCSIDGAEIQHPASSRKEVSKQDHFEIQVKPESQAEILTQDVFEAQLLLDDTKSMSDLGLPLSVDTKQIMQETEMLRVHSSKDTLELETTEKPFFYDEVPKRSEFMLLEGLYAQKELQESPSEFVTHEVHPLQADKSEVDMLDLSAAFPLANTEGQPPFSETESQDLCTDGLIEVHKAVQNVSKTDCVEWQSLLEKRSRETQMSCDMCETHEDMSFLGEDYSSNTQLNEEQEMSSHDTDKKRMTFNLRGFNIGSKCMVSSGGQWHKAQISGTSAEGTKTLNNETSTLDSLLECGLEAEEQEIATGSDSPPCGNFTENTPE